MGCKHDRHTKGAVDSLCMVCGTGGSGPTALAMAMKRSGSHKWQSVTTPHSATQGANTVAHMGKEIIMQSNLIISNSQKKKTPISLI